MLTIKMGANTGAVVLVEGPDPELSTIDLNRWKLDQRAAVINIMKAKLGMEQTVEAR